MQNVLPEQLDPKHPRRIVIVGSGYAGMTAAVTLGQKSKPEDKVEIVLVSILPYQEALSELDLVVAGNPRPNWVELWHGDIFKNLPIKVVYERLDSLDIEANAITLGPKGAPTAVIPFWRLILATGAIASVPPIPGLKEHGITMWSARDAAKVQERILQQLQRAATKCSDTACSLEMSVCVIGGGATGVEIVGTIADVWPRMLKRLGYEQMRATLTLLEGRPDILYDLKKSERERAKERLEKMGVKLVLGEKLASVQSNHLTTDSGRRIPAHITIWCGGAKADPDAAEWGLENDNSGRLVVDAEYRIPGHPEIFAVGDVAAYRDPESNKVIPMLAQYAMRSADYAAKSTLADLRGTKMKPFDAAMHGEFVSVGPRWGIGEMFGIPIRGRIAIVFKRFTYIYYWMLIGSFRLAWRRTRQMMQMHRY